MLIVDYLGEPLSESSPESSPEPLYRRIDPDRIPLEKRTKGKEDEVALRLKETIDTENIATTNHSDATDSKVAKFNTDIPAPDLPKEPSGDAAETNVWKARSTHIACLAFIG
ncbi:MAG: hypothetical protein H7240_08820 [Glaciimonas sp.]|nr:hypothetical protein [Glaciimonas sp.]